MALETGTHISDLNAANPVSTDGLAQADDHLRLIKGDHQGHVPQHQRRNERHAHELNGLEAASQRRPLPH